MENFEYNITSINEDLYEQAIIEHLVKNQGYTHMYGPDVPRTSEAYEDVFLPGILEESITKINSKLPEQAITEAILKLNNVEIGSLEQRNETFTSWLQDGIEVHFFDGKEDRDDIVKLLDYEDVENNTFHVVNQ